MIRIARVCKNCDDLVWIAESDAPPQSVRCRCTAVHLTDKRATGPARKPTTRELLTIGGA